VDIGYNSSRETFNHKQCVHIHGGGIPVDVTTGGARPLVRDLGHKFMTGDRLMEDVTWSEGMKILGQQLLEDKQFWEGRTVMFLSK
jgi:hypothetical protein